MTTIAAGRLGATSASVSAYFIPVVALLLGVLVRNEHVAMLSLIGGAISLVAAWIVRWASMRAAAAAARAGRHQQPAAGEVGRSEAVRLDPLPIDAHVDAVVDAVRRRRAAVIVAPPGAGKTTRLPPALAADGPVLVLQPRRVAARAIARRIADERGWTLGQEVGWHVRFERRFTAATRVLLATEGILTARLVDDPLISGVRTIVLDEFHERIHPRRPRPRAGAAGLGGARRSAPRRDVGDARGRARRALSRRLSGDRRAGPSASARRRPTRPASPIARGGAQRVAGLARHRAVLPARRARRFAAPTPRSRARCRRPRSSICSAGSARTNRIARCGTAHRPWGGA